MKYLIIFLISLFSLATYGQNGSCLFMVVQNADIDGPSGSGEASYCNLEIYSCNQMIESFNLHELTWIELSGGHISIRDDERTFTFNPVTDMCNKTGKCNGCNDLPGYFSEPWYPGTSYIYAECDDAVSCDDYCNITELFKFFANAKASCIDRIVGDSLYFGGQWLPIGYTDLDYWDTVANLYNQDRGVTNNGVKSDVGIDDFTFGRPKLYYQFGDIAPSPLRSFFGYDKSNGNFITGFDAGNARINTNNFYSLINGNQVIAALNTGSVLTGTGGIFSGLQSGFYAVDGSGASINSATNSVILAGQTSTINNMSRSFVTSGFGQRILNRVDNEGSQGQGANLVLVGNKNQTLPPSGYWNSIQGENRNMIYSLFNSDINEVLSGQGGQHFGYIQGYNIKVRNRIKGSYNFIQGFGFLSDNLYGMRNTVAFGDGHEMNNNTTSAQPRQMSYNTLFGQGHKIIDDNCNNQPHEFNLIGGVQNYITTPWTTGANCPLPGEGGGSKVNIVYGTAHRLNGINRNNAIFGEAILMNGEKQRNENSLVYGESPRVNGADACLIGGGLGWSRFATSGSNLGFWNLNTSKVSGFNTLGSFIQGVGLHNNIYGSTVVGTNNYSHAGASIASSLSWVANDPAFMVGVAIPGTFSGASADTALNTGQNGLVVLKGTGHVGFQINNFTASALNIHPIAQASGAHLTAGGVWTDASDSIRKFDIANTPYGTATLLQLQPKTFNYKTGLKKYKGCDIQGMLSIQKEFEDTFVITISYDTLSYIITDTVYTYNCTESINIGEDTYCTVYDTSFVINVESIIDIIPVADTSVVEPTFEGWQWWAENQDSIKLFFSGEVGLHDDIFDSAPQSIYDKCHTTAEIREEITKGMNLADFTEIQDVKAVGFVAQDVMTVIPEAVSGTPGEMSLDYNAIIATLVKTVQELESRIKVLEGP